MKPQHLFTALVIAAILQAATAWCATSMNADSIRPPAPAHHNVLTQLGAVHPALVEAATGRIIPAQTPAAVARVNTAAGTRRATPAAPGAPQMVYPRPFPCTNRIRTVALFQEFNPWGSTLLPYLLATNGISYTILGTNDMGLVDLSPFDKVILVSAQSNDFYDLVNYHNVWFSQYAYQGGILEMHLATKSGYLESSGLWLPGGFIAAPYEANAVTITNADFPMFRTPHLISDAALDNWDNSTHGYFSYYPYGAQPLVYCTDTNVPPCAIDYPYGAGRILATLQPVEWRKSSTNYCENMLLYAGYNNVALLQDTNPWGSRNNQDVLVSNNMAYMIFGANDLGHVSLTPFDKVIVVSDQPSNFYARVASTRAWLETYAAQGGLLDLHMAAYAQFDLDAVLFPGNIAAVELFYNAVTIVDPAAPVLTTPHPISGPDLNGWSFSTHGFFTAIPAGAHRVVAHGLNGQPCAMTVPYGSGKIFATVQPVEYAYASFDYLENTILDGAVPAPALNILVYTDDPHHPAPNTYVEQALRHLGLPYAPYYDDAFTFFTWALTNGPPWDLVLFANDNYAPPPSLFNLLQSYVNGGGKLAMHTWYMSNAATNPLWAALGAAFVANVPSVPAPIYWWDYAHALFTTPISVPMFTIPAPASYGVYGQHLAATNGGNAVAGYTVLPGADNAALIVGASGRTVLRGFTDAQFSQDFNGNERADDADLWINIIDALNVPEPALPGMLGCAALLRAWRRR